MACFFDEPGLELFQIEHENEVDPIIEKVCQDWIPKFEILRFACTSFAKLKEPCFSIECEIDILFLISGQLQIVIDW
jgi:hypothetical protein